MGDLERAGSGLHDGGNAGGGAIFEAELPSEIYAYRAGRNAEQAVVEVEELIFRGHPDVIEPTSTNARVRTGCGNP